LPPELIRLVHSCSSQSSLAAPALRGNAAGVHVFGINVGVLIAAKVSHIPQSDVYPALVDVPTTAHARWPRHADEISAIAEMASDGGTADGSRLLRRDP